MPLDTKNEVNSYNAKETEKFNATPDFHEKAEKADLAKWNKGTTNINSDSYDWTNDAKEFVEQNLRERKGELADDNLIDANVEEEKTTETNNENAKEIKQNESNEVKENSSRDNSNVKNVAVPDRAKETAENKTTKSEETAASKLFEIGEDSAKDSAKDTKEEIKVMAQNTKETIENKVSDDFKRDEDIADEKPSELVGIAEYTRDTLVGRAVDMKDAALSAYHLAGEYIEEKKSQAVEMAGNAKDAVLNKASELKDTVSPSAPSPDTPKSVEDEIAQLAEDTKRILADKGRNLVLTEENSKPITESLIDATAAISNTILEKSKEIYGSLAGSNKTE